MSTDVGAEFRSNICTVCFSHRWDQFMSRCFCELVIVLSRKRNRVPLAAHSLIASVPRIRKNQLGIKRVNFALTQRNAFGAEVFAICRNDEIVVCGLKYRDRAERRLA